MVVEQRVAQGAGQHTQRAGAAQELAQLGRQVAEHLPDEVGAHQPRSPGQVGQRPPPLRGWAALGEQVEHREPRRPAAGALRQRRGVLGRQRLVVDLAEQPLDLPGPEPQVVGVDDVHGAVDPQRRHVEPDDPARAEHHPQRRRGERDHPGQAVLGLRPRDGVEVVEDEQQVAARGVERGRDVVERPAVARQAGLAQRAADPPGQLGGVAVRRVDPIPDDGAGEPRRDLARAASSCRARRGRAPARRGGRPGRADVRGPAPRARAARTSPRGPAGLHPPCTPHLDVGGRGRVPRQLRCPARVTSATRDGAGA